MQKIKEVWGKTKLPLFIILMMLGTWGWTTFAFLFPPMYQENQKVWSDHLKRQSERIEIKDGKEVEAKAETSMQVNPKEEREAADNPSPPSGIEEILRKVRILESSGGKNDSCLTKGMVNGYGFMQSTFHWRCYKSHEEVKTLVAEWYQDKFKKGYTLEESLCYYNRGIKTNDCEYAKNFIAIK